MQTDFAKVMAEGIGETDNVQAIEYFNAAANALMGKTVEMRSANGETSDFIADDEQAILMAIGNMTGDRVDHGQSPDGILIDMSNVIRRRIDMEITM